jgi:ABC-type transport system involved in multi-copper enzyme maturation permease subunit
MTALDIAYSLTGLRWLTGPILEKELRVASRRRRNYVLRAAYLALFTLILALIWANTLQYRSGVRAYDIAGMSRVSQEIAAFIVWFQFIASQFIAVVLLSTAISDEIYNRTLGVLMTTPINAFQIVIGKLTSRMLQLLVLISLSMPVLAVIRVFGGIPWVFLLESLAVTFCTILFAGTLSLFYSIFCRRAYIAIILTLLTMAAGFLLAPGLVYLTIEAFSINRMAATSLATEWITVANPWVCLVAATEHLGTRRGAMGAPSLSIHCLIMLAASATLILLAVACVRKAALRQIAGGASAAPVRKGRSAARSVHDARIASVTGSPIVWKELRTPLFRRRLVTVIPLAIGVVLLLITYGLCALAGGLRGDIQGAYVITLGLFGMLFAVAIPAGAISGEKESRSWLLLLTTTLGDWNILLGKALGSLRRILPCFGVMALHIVVFTLVGYIHPVCLFQSAIPLMGAVLFLTGTGLYFSSLFRHTTTAVVANFLLAIGIWLFAPILSLMFSGLAHFSVLDAEQLFDVNPIAHWIVIVAATAADFHGEQHITDLRYYFPGGNSCSALEATVWASLLAGIYAFCGFLFAWRAKCRFRRNIL